MSQAVATQPTQAAKGFTTAQRLRGWLGNPWGRPRFLVLITWGYIFWSIAPVLVAIQFSFNNSRSLSVWHGFTTKWYLTDPIYSVRYSPDLRGALAQSMKLAVLDVVIATPIGVLLALGLARWRGRGSGASNFLMLFPLVTPEIVMGVSLLLLFSQLLTVVPFGTWAQVLGHVTFSISYVVVIVRGRLFSIVRGGRRRPGRVTRSRPLPRAAAAAAARSRGQRCDRVCDLDRRLRDQPVAVERRQLDHRADDHLRRHTGNAAALDRRHRDGDHGHHPALGCGRRDGVQVLHPR
jgi:hypothetical protein